MTGVLVHRGREPASEETTAELDSTCPSNIRGTIDEGKTVDVRRERS